MKYLASILTTIVLTALLSVPAIAAEITEWEYTVSYEFSDYWNQDGIGKQDGLTPDSFVNGSGEQVNALNWGDDEQSSIGFITKTGTLATGSSTDIVDHLYHDNHPITGDNFLQGGKMSATLNLQGIDPYSGSVATFSTVLEFLFFETDNSHLLNTSLNNDVFLLLNPEASVEDFVYQDYSYTFAFASGLGALDMVELAYMDYDGSSVLQKLEDWGHGEILYDQWWIFEWVDGWDPETNIVGWTTPEDQVTYASSRLQITSNGPVPTPEPSTFAIFGMGILGLAFASRRMRKQ